MSYSTSTVTFQILKAIDVSYENKNFDFNETLNLEKLEINEHRLELFLENLVNDDFLMGIKVSRSIGGNCSLSIGLPRLTLRGMDYLENNSTMKKAYSTLKEIKGWIPGL